MPLTYTTPLDVVTDELITAARMNAQIMANIRNLINPPTCRVYRSTNQSITTATSTAITFNSERFDTDAMHDVVTNTDRITINTAGLYVISGNVTFDTSATGIRELTIELNGTTAIARLSVGNRSDNYNIASVTCAYKLAATDFVKLVVYQTSGGALNVLSQANFSPEFSAVWVGLG
jgi:hypothetical protein